MSKRRHFWILLALIGGRPIGPAAATPPPAPWRVGNVGLANGVGTVDVDARGVWSLRAATIDAPLVLDSLFLVHQPLVGDGSVLAMLLSQAGGNAEWGQAGVSLLERAALRTRAVHLHMTTGHGVAFAYRAAPGLSPITETGDGRYGVRRFPIWLRLQREGDRFTPFSSADGDAWTQLRAPLSVAGMPSEAVAAITAASGQGEPVRALLASPVITPGLLSPLVDTFTGDGSVLLSWPPVRGAVGYIIRRGAPEQPVYASATITSAPIRETTFSESGLPNGKPVRYLVSALFPDGTDTVEGWLTATTVTPVALPYQMICGDINVEAPQMKGTCSFAPTTGVYRVNGTGSAPGGTQDRCFLTARRLTGDFEISAQILERPTRTDALSSAGLMLRESLASDSRMLFLAASATRGLSLYVRGPTAGSALPIGPPILADRDFRPPLYLRLARRGTQVTAAYSQDGIVFQPAGTPITFGPALPASVFAGYAITSANAGRAATNTFRFLRISPPP